MRRLLWTAGLPALLACALVAAPARTVSAGGAGVPRDLLPNLVELPPSDIVVGPVAGGAPGRWELRFTSIAGNSGAGPLEVRSSRATASLPFVATQAIALAGGTTRSRPLAVTIRYRAAPGHAHFHIARFERYELRDATGKLLARDTKAGYCLGDRALLGTPARRARFTAPCGRGKPGLLRLTQGISTGWADPYAASLPGQSFLLTGLPGGEYTLVNRVNDQGLYLESSLRDNVAAAKLRLEWPDGPTGKPVVTVLDTCLAERCG